VFFWAPMMKWCLVAAGLKDLSRPAEKLSVSQNAGSYTTYAASKSRNNYFLYSPRLHRLYLGALLLCYHSRELQLGCCESPIFRELSS
jgi:hypothetical protein